MMMSVFFTLLSYLVVYYKKNIVTCNGRHFGEYLIDQRSQSMSVFTLIVAYDLFTE